MRSEYWALFSLCMVLVGVPYVSQSWLIPCRLQTISRLDHHSQRSVPKLLSHVRRVSIGLNRADHFLFMSVKGNDDKERILANMFSVSSASKRIVKNIQNDNIIDTTILEENDAQDGDIDVTRGNATRQNNNNAARDEVAQILFPSKDDAEEEEEYDEMTIHEEINEIINILVAIDEMGEINNLKPSFLTERAHFLCNGKKYEEVYQARLKEDSSTPEQLERLQRVHSLLSGFISSEKKLRSRLKVNYVLACILDKQMLEEAVKTLSSAGEIDDDVIMYLKSLKETERKRRKGLQAMMEISDEPDFNQELDSIDALNNDQKRDYIIERDLKSQARNRIETKESSTYRLLDLIEKRLRAEILELQTKREVKLLSDILQESTYEGRISLLKDKLHKIEDIYSFEDFTQGGIEYLQNQYVNGRKPEMYGEDTGKIVERLKGVLEDIKKYTTLLKSGCSAPDEIYSTYESGDRETPSYKNNAPSLKNNNMDNKL